MSANRSDRDHVPTSGIEPSHHDRSQRQRLYRYYSTPASPWKILPGMRLVTCSAEDLVVHKVFAGQDRDWLDVEGIAARQGSALDHGLISSQLGPLLELKETAADLDRLRAILDRNTP